MTKACYHAEFLIAMVSNTNDESITESDLNRDVAQTINNSNVHLELLLSSIAL